MPSERREVYDLVLASSSPPAYDITVKASSTKQSHISKEIMGLPQNQVQPASDSQTQPETSKSVNQLPPEALELATKLFNYAREGKTPELQQYISAGIPVNLTNHKGDTLVMLAAYHGKLETVNMLLEQGADANALNERGQSPLAGAVFKGCDEVVKALYEKGADVNAGHPNAVDSAKMFKKDEYLRLFGAAEESS